MVEAGEEVIERFGGHFQGAGVLALVAFGKATQQLGLLHRQVDQPSSVAAVYRRGQRVLRSRDTGTSLVGAVGFGSGNRWRWVASALDSYRPNPDTDTSRTITDRGCIAEVPALEPTGARACTG